MNNQTTGKKLLAIFAHPDDEAIMMGGTLAYYARRGVDVNLICATRGEWGMISDSALATQENLGAVRERELCDACEILGVKLEGFLGCPDGNINNTDWREIEEKIVRSIRTLRPQVIVTFGLDGLYEHPDHIAISMLVTASFKSAADENCFTHQFEEGLPPFQASKLYFAQYPDFLMRELFAALGKERADLKLWGFDADCFGVPAEVITTILNVEETLDEKMRAIRAHRTQLAADNIFALIGNQIARRFLAKEYFRLIGDEKIEPILEDDLFNGI